MPLTNIVSLGAHHSDILISYIELDLYVNLLAKENSSDYRPCLLLSWVSLYLSLSLVPLEYGTAYDEHTLFFSPDPLHDLHRALRQCSSTRVWRRNSIQLKKRCTPCERYAARTRLMMDLQTRRLRMQRCMQMRIQAH